MKEINREFAVDRNVGKKIAVSKEAAHNNQT